MHAIARVGLCARALTYALLAYLTVDILRNRSSSPSGKGALSQAAREPGGTALLTALAVGFFAYAAWRILQVFGRETGGTRITFWTRFGWLWIAAVYGWLGWQALTVLSGSASSGNASNHPTPFVATALRWPGGADLVGAAGAGLCIGGISVGIWACLHDYRRTFDNRISPRSSLVARVSGIAGQVTRGLWILLVGAYLLTSAIDANPTQAKGTGSALQSLAGWPAGPFLLIAGAIGLLAFAVYSGFEAAHRKL
jgi:hypothetical protein